MATPPTFTTGQVLTAAQMNTVGMFKIAEQTVSSATQFVFDNIFTSDYLNYYCTVTITGATSTSMLFWQERAGGVNASTAYSYAGSAVYLSGGSGFQNILAGQALGQGAVGSFDGASGSQGLMAFEICAPQTSTYTAVTGRFSVTTGNTGMYSGTVGSVHYVTNTYDGMRLFVGLGNFSGTCRVYGIRN